MRGIAGEKQAPVAHGLGDVAAQWRDRFLDWGPGGDRLGPVAWKPCLELLPEPGVGPVLDPRVERHLDVVAAERRAALRGEREAARRMAVRDFLERRRLRQDAKPAERIDLLVFPLLRDATARDAVEAIAAGNEVAVELPRFAAVLETDGPVQQLHVGSLGDELRAAPVGRGKQVLLQARLPITHEALAAVAACVHAGRPPP